MEQNNIDFRQLIAAKLSLKDLEKVQEHITLAEVHFPSFMRPFSAYQAKLREIARLNGLAILPKREPVKTPVEPPPLPEVVEIVKDVTRTGPAKPKSDRQKGNPKGVREINTPNVGKPVSRRAQKVIEPPVDEDDIRLQQCSRLLKNLKSLALLPVDAMPHNQQFAFHTPEHREIVDITPNDVIPRPSMLEGSEETSWKPATAYLDFKQNEQTSPFARNPRVCGCSLFLYGRLSSNRQFTPAEGDAVLPVVLELDLRHPILDTMH
ncbi:unnamed protein product [Dibothriocephalus latus]|uniref:Uncharacterized protein n=1 Tax=Dibothriocephalus latus TaxID=60516 RepID=A0A3P7LZ99_DIBLA|nr:unnamed protein product [Dibothriocephalus latus]